MDGFARLRHALRLDQDALADFRHRIAARLSVLAALLVLPFALVHAAAGNWAVAVLIGSVNVILAVNGWAMQRGRQPPVPFFTMSLALVVGVCGAVALQGVLGVFWSYPALFIIYFVLRRRVALPLSLVLLAGTTTVVALVLGPALAARVFGTLGFTVVMINVVLNVIGDLQGALVAQTITDPLTGAFNRRHLDQQLASITARGADPRAANVLLAIDLDHFKRINDRHGHVAGDRVLQAFVGCLNGRIRRGDVLFRTGGEEFMLLLPRTALADAERVAEDLRRLVEQTVLLSGECVTVSIGVAAQCAGQGAADWVHAADQALYEAKRSGRNRVALAGQGAQAPR